MTDSVVGTSPTPAEITAAAEKARNANLELANLLDHFTYSLPDDIDEAATAAECLRESFQFSEHVLVGWNHALPTPKTAMTFYDFSQRALLRGVKLRTRSASRAAFNVGYAFFDSLQNIRQLRDYGAVTELD